MYNLRIIMIEERGYIKNLAKKIADIKKKVAFLKKFYQQECVITPMDE